MKRTFTAGDTDPAGDCDKFEAGIHVRTPGGNDSTDGSPWWQRIVVYGDTPADAEALRDEVLDALTSVPRQIDTPGAAPSGLTRDLCGESLHGMRVAGWRWEFPIPPELQGSEHAYSFASHWSTGPQDSQERLYAESDVLNLLARVALLESAVRENHAWHVLYDEHSGYPESGLQQTNLTVLAGAQ